MRPIALALFGGICSGKTTFALEMERKYNFRVISKDRCIYYSDIRNSNGNNTTWEKIRVEKAESLNGENVVLDETIRIGRLTKIKEKGYIIIAIKLTDNMQVRKARLATRNQLRESYYDQLSNLIHLDINLLPQQERRHLLNNRIIYNNINNSKKKEYDDLVKNLYLLGSTYIKDEEPNPLCFKEVDYVLNISDLVDTKQLCLDYILKNMIPIKEYKEAQLKKIKYIIWGGDNVISKYSFAPLKQWCIQNTHRTINHQPLERKFSFRDYILGNLEFSDMCKMICDYYSIQYSLQAQQEIKKMICMGISPSSPSVIQITELFRNKGYINCILANALPIVTETKQCYANISAKFSFYSHDTHILKPDNKAFTIIRDKLHINFDEMLFIDSNQSNVNAAIELGIYSIQYRPEYLNVIIQEFQLD